MPDPHTLHVMYNGKHEHRVLPLLQAVYSQTLNTTHESKNLHFKAYRSKSGILCVSVLYH